jgi:hypothetical protein
MGTSDSILHEIDRLLDKTEASAFVEASVSRRVSPNIRAALESLAVEALRRQVRRSAPPAERFRTQRRAASLLPGTSPARKLDKSQIAALIARSKAFPDKRAIARFVQHFGLGHPPSPRESMGRAVSKLASAICEADPITQERIMEELMGSVDEQTRGWFDLIRS